MSRIKMFLFALLLLLSAAKAKAQYSEEELKSVFIYKFAQSLVWPEMHDSDHFVVGVMKSDRKMYEAFSENLAGKTIEGLGIEVRKVGFSELDTFNAHILYIPRSYNKRIRDIAGMTDGRRILRVSDEVDKKELIMINFIDENGTVNFEINPLAISAADIQVSQKLLLLGGNEIDAINIYRDMQKRLKREISRVEAQTRKIENQKESMDEQLKAISYQGRQIKQQRRILEKQEQQLQRMEKRLEEGRERLEKQDLLLMQGQQALALSKKRTEAVNKEALEYREEIQKSRKTLSELEHAIRENKELIARQRTSLDEQEMTIKKHKFYLYIAISVALLLAVIAYFIFRNYRLKNRINKMLSEKNEEILVQKKQLEHQTEILDAANKRLEDSYSQINAGIRYAKTIQAAVLPQLSSISDFFESFVLYRPKDYVSGDFFWAKTLEKSGRKYFFAAVVDCTGHGVPGAFMSFVGNRILDEIVISEKETDTLKILEKMHDKVFRLFQTDDGNNRDGMVLSLVRIEKIGNEHCELVFSGAKQAVFIKEAGSDSLTRLRGDVKEIGSPHYDMIDFTSHQMTLPSGSFIYMMSDGLADQNNANRKKFGTHRIRMMLKEAVKLDISEQHKFVAGELDEFQQNAEQRDDITLMGLKL
jgi:serine phosphatase RsbU (regulator of sigma subunit)